jgi:hypothetical protein
MEASSAARRTRELLAVPVLLAASFFASGVPVADNDVNLQLGPNDHRYLEGFATHYEIADGIATRWTTYHARVDLPLVLEGGPSEISYRFSRVFPETAEAALSLDGATVDRFSARGGAVETRRVPVTAASPTPISLGFEIDSHERRNMGLRLDWIRISVGPDAAVRLRGMARVLPALLAVFLYCLFLIGGLRLGSALLCASLFAGAVFAATRVDIFGVAHVVRELAAPLVVLSTVAALFLRGRPFGAWTIPIFVAGYLIKGYGLFHPTTFYPDVENARDYVEEFRDTSGSLAERGVATQERTNVGYPREIGGKAYAFPYSPLYFLPFGLARTPGGIEDAVRHAGLAASSLTALSVFWLASMIFSPRAGLLASLLWCFLPPVFSRLLLALHATLVGNLLDTLVIASVLALAYDPRSPRRLVVVSMTTFASLLVYTSSLFSVSSFMLFESILERKLALRLVVVLLVCGTITVTWLYWPFLFAFATEILPALARGLPAPPAEVQVSPAWLALSRVPLFYGFLYPALAIFGLLLARRRDPRAFRVLAAWSLGVVLMVSLRAFGGGLFKDLKEIEFAAPLVAILSGASLSDLAGRGRWGKPAAAALVLALVVFGLARYRGYLETYASPVTAMNASDVL